MSGTYVPFTTHYIVSPDSLQTWFSEFVDLAPGGRIIYLNETAPIDDRALIAQLALLGDPRKTNIIFCSSHTSLARDCNLAEGLSTRGYQVAGVNRSAVLYGENKQAMKELFNALNIATPAWTPLHPGDTVEMILSRLRNAEYIVKDRSGSNGIGNFYFDSAPPSIADQYYYAEIFEEGDEYSVVALTSGDNIATLPPVWKGPTRRDLLPPYKRLRVCPFPLLDPALEIQMRMIAETLARTARIDGLLEVEYIITPDERLLVIEVNPRLAGTVLMSAMATETKIFSLLGQDTPSVEYTSRAATRCTIEMPWQGQAPKAPFQGVHFTTRMTVSGSTYQQILEKIQQVTKLGVTPDAQALDTFIKKIMPLTGKRTP